MSLNKNTNRDIDKNISKDLKSNGAGGGLMIGRPAIYRWPGLEKIWARVNELGPAAIPHTRQEELALALAESDDREKEYSGTMNTSQSGAIEIDFENLRFDLGEGGVAHTTIDFNKITDKNSCAIITTSDFVVFNKMKKMLFPATQNGGVNDEVNKSAGSGWEIIDLKINSTGSALYFVTVRAPIGDIKKVLNKY